MTQSEFSPLDPKTTSLLVMDCQPKVLAAIPAPGELVPRIRTAVTITRDAGCVVSHVRLAFTEADYARVPRENKTFWPIAQQKLYRDAEPAHDFHADLTPVAGDVVVRKTRVGAFTTTDLDSQLRARGIKTVILAGVWTSGVVLSTLREAADRDYRVVVLADATADPSVTIYQMLIRDVFPRQAWVCKVADLPQSLGLL